MKKKSHTKPANHGPEYDFALEEVEPFLSSFPAWHSQLTDQEVTDKLMGYLTEDGHFLLFYWERRKRPAISLTHNGQVDTFVIHKKPAKDGNSRTLYYVERCGPYESSIQNLINAHIQKGIADESMPSPQNTVRLQFPVSS